VTTTVGPPEIRAYGDRGLMLACREDEVPVWLAAIDDLDDPRILEVCPGAATVMVRFDPLRCTAADVTAVLARLSPTMVETSPVSHLVEVPVVYDGIDLADLVRATGLRTDEVVALHCAPTYRVAFVGFAPGFAYLRGLDPRLTAPRLDSPRPEVPAGSVGIADQWTGVYPRSSPGGWRLIGRTPLSLWNEADNPPARLSPGVSVRFVPVGAGDFDDA